MCVCVRARVCVCACVCVTVNRNTMLLVMEFVSNGCLRDYLRKHNKTSPDELLRYGFEIVEVPSPVYLQKHLDKRVAH